MNVLPGPGLPVSAFSSLSRRPGRTVAINDFELDQTSGDRPAGIDEERGFHLSLLMLIPKSIEFRFEYSNSSIRQKF